MTCGGGERLRTRRCFNGHPGDEGCDGDEMETEPCSENVILLFVLWGLLQKYCRILIFLNLQGDSFHERKPKYK